MEKKRVEFQAVPVLASGTVNLGCAPQHENSKHRTGRIACATKAMPQLAQESRFLAVLGMTGLCGDLFCALEFEWFERTVLRGNE
jgi:hypothetical protein